MLTIFLNVLRRSSAFLLKDIPPRLPLFQKRKKKRNEKDKMSFLSFAMNFVLLPPEMMAPQHIHIDDYTYPLPDDRIARYPLPQRDRSKLLVYRGGQIGETVFNRLPDELPSDALLVFNNTRVIRARLLFHKTTGVQIEFFCVREFPGGRRRGGGRRRRGPLEL